MKETQLEPARSIIALLGRDVVCRVTGKHQSRVYRWMSPKAKGGTDGKVPWEDAHLLLEYARAHSIDLIESDFFSADRLLAARSAA